MLDERAETRMDNTIKQSKRNQMVGPGNEAAKQSLRHQVKGPEHKGGPPVGIPQRELPPPKNIPTGGPALSAPSLPEEFDVGIFKEDLVEGIANQVRTFNFINSPAAKDARTSVELKEIFNKFNPNKRPDPRSFVDRVVNRMGINPNE
jgi:hypothetical protein